MLFDDSDTNAAQALRQKVGPERSRTEDRLPVHSFRLLLADLATLE